MLCRRLFSFFSFGHAPVREKWRQQLFLLRLLFFPSPREAYQNRERTTTCLHCRLGRVKTWPDLTRRKQAHTSRRRYSVLTQAATTAYCWRRQGEFLPSKTSHCDILSIRTPINERFGSMESLQADLYSSGSEKRVIFSPLTVSGIWTSFPVQ